MRDYSAKHIVTEAGAEGGELPPAELSAFRRMRIIAIGVAQADATVFSTDQHFRLLVLCDATGNSDRLRWQIVGSSQNARS